MTGSIIFTHFFHQTIYTIFKVDLSMWVPSLYLVYKILSIILFMKVTVLSWTKDKHNNWLCFFKWDMTGLGKTIKSEIFNNWLIKRLFGDHIIRSAGTKS